MNNKEPGYVYILTNPSFREDWVKIGKSSRIFFIGTYMPEDHSNASDAYQGAKYFSYERKIWNEIRKEREN
jgi:hypothetical protein